MLVLGGLLIGCASARADDDPIKKKLDDAKKAYEAEVKNFREAAEEWFGDREKKARELKNKKLVDQIKAERDAFQKSGELPKTVPADLKRMATAGRPAMLKAYKIAVDDYTGASKDDLAAAVEKEQKEFEKGGSASGAPVTGVTPKQPSLKSVVSDLKPLLEAMRDRADHKRGNGTDYHREYTALATKLDSIIKRANDGKADIAELKEFKTDLEKSRPYTKPTKQGQKEEIEAGLKVLNKAIGPPATVRPGEDLLQKGTKWEGTKFFGGTGARRTATLEVTERDGKQFKAQLTVVNNGENVVQVEGTIEKGAVELRSPEGSGQPKVMKGQLTKDKLELTGRADNATDQRLTLSKVNVK